VNQGLATLAFFGVGVNLVLFLTRVLGQNNADAANTVSKWTGTVYIFSLVGAFLSDSYWGRFKTCAIFQIIFVVVSPQSHLFSNVIFRNTKNSTAFFLKSCKKQMFILTWMLLMTQGLASLSLSSYLFLIKPKGCGDQTTPCREHSSMEIGLFYLSIYLVALGNGGYQPNIATFGADQFDAEHSREAHSKVAFFSYFYLAMNLGSLFSNTILGYFEDDGMWALGFWVSAGSAFAALVLFLIGTPSYRHFKPTGNPLSRVCQVIVAAIRKWKVQAEGQELYEVEAKECTTNVGRKMLHTEGFK